MTLSGRTSPETRARLKKLCAFFDKLNTDYFRETKESSSYPGVKIQSLQRPVGYDIHVGPEYFSGKKYNYISKQTVQMDKD